jgi:hypothetical protein
MRGGWSALFGRLRRNSATGRRRAPDRGRARPCRRRAAAALLLPALLAVSTRPLLAAEPEVRARWEELPALVEGRDVEMVLRNGVYVRGRAGEATPDALQVRVRKTSDPEVIPKGPTAIPREQVSVLTVRWRKGPARLRRPRVPCEPHSSETPAGGRGRSVMSDSLESPGES